jgi:hypothetical protein
MRKTKPNLGELGYMGNSHRRVGPGSPGGETCETNPISPRRQDAGRAWRRAPLYAGATPDQVGGRLYEGPKRAKRTQFWPGSGVNAQNKPNLATRELTLNNVVKGSYGRFACVVPRKNKANFSIADCSHETLSHTSGGCGRNTVAVHAVLIGVAGAPSAFGVPRLRGLLRLKAGLQTRSTPALACDPSGFPGAGGWATHRICPYMPTAPPPAGGAGFSGCRPGGKAYHGAG